MDLNAIKLVRIEKSENDRFLIHNALQEYILLCSQKLNILFLISTFAHTRTHHKSIAHFVSLERARIFEFQCQKLFLMRFFCLGFSLTQTVWLLVKSYALQRRSEHVEIRSFIFPQRTFLFNSLALLRTSI